mmetsp:Transcript_30731/g.73833  ORF Transcript_30731/g.73833 Transcript_30731/m.73833 type:complete len:261 (-) Transcript_30731:45-827(-)
MPRLVSSAAVLFFIVQILQPCDSFSGLSALSALQLRSSKVINALLPSTGMRIRTSSLSLSMTNTEVGGDPIISPFDPTIDERIADDDDDESQEALGGGPLDLTEENVERVLDQMRPYLISDGGNVKLVEIDGGVVKLKLEGACGTCPSSTMTMKMGLERGLREKIPEIIDVVQDMGEGGPELSPESVETVLETVRPFLKVAGGTIDLFDLRGVGGMQPVIVLKMTGTSAALRSVKNEIMQRLQRNFMVPGLRIEWEGEGA